MPPKNIAAPALGSLRQDGTDVIARTPFEAGDGVQDYRGPSTTQVLALSAQALVPLRMTDVRENLFGEEVVEGFYGGEFVVFDVEDGVELGDMEDVLNFFGEAEEFEFAAGVADGGVAADQFSDAGGVDVVDLSKIEDDFFLARIDELVDGVAEFSGFVAERDASVDVDDGDVADFAGGDGHGGSPDCIANTTESTTETRGHGENLGRRRWKCLASST